MKVDIFNEQICAWQNAGTAAECEAVISANIKSMDLWMTTHKPVIVMCSPKYYSVDKGNDASGEVAGNAFLKNGYDAYFKDSTHNYAVMQQEWQRFHDILVQKGAEILMVPAQEEFPDQVFTADHSFSCVRFLREGNQLQPNGAVTVLSRLAHPNRINEMRVYEDFLESLKDDARTKALMDDREIVQAQSFLEGAGDNVIDPYRGIIISGYGCRNEESSLQALQFMTGIPVHGVRCRKPFFHIDTCFAALPDGYVMYAPEVMHPESVAALEDALFKGHQELKQKYAIIVSKEDAYRFACNVVMVGKSIVMQECSDELKSVLKNKGLDVTYTTARIANYAGGSLHCMSNTFNQPVFGE